MASDSQQLRVVFRSTMSNLGTPWFRDIRLQLSSFWTMYVDSMPALHRDTRGDGGEGIGGASSCCNHTTSNVIVVARQASTPSAPADDEAQRQPRGPLHFFNRSVRGAQHSVHALWQGDKHLLYRCAQASVSMEILLLVEILSRWSNTWVEFDN